MYFRFIMLLLLVVSGNFARASDCGMRPSVTYEDRYGEKTGILITEERMRGVPAWSPEKGENSEPPLSVGAAIHIVKLWIKSKRDKKSDLHIFRVSLPGTSCWALRGYWYYLFQLVPNKQDGALPYNRLFVAVLMDGSIVEPIPVKQ